MNLGEKPESHARQSKLLLVSAFGLIVLAPVSLAQTQSEPQSSVESSLAEGYQSVTTLANLATTQAGRFREWGKLFCFF
jgi:hypothetical protein